MTKASRISGYNLRKRRRPFNTKPVEDQSLSSLVFYGFLVLRESKDKVKWQWGRRSQMILMNRGAGLKSQVLKSQESNPCVFQSMCHDAELNSSCFPNGETAGGQRWQLA